MLSARELAEVCVEIERALGGRPLQKVVQPDNRTVELGFHGGWLLISVDPRFGRLHLLVEKPPGRGETPPAFCMLLRKELMGKRLVQIRSVAGERAAELVFARAGEERRLWLFLYGRSAQLALVDGECAPLGALGPARQLHETLPAAGPDSSQSRFGTEPGLSTRIEALYGQESSAQALEAARLQAAAVVRGELKRESRREAALLQDRARALLAVDKRKLGDLLLAHLGEIEKGAATVTLADDFVDGAPLSIALDPALGARENAARFYKEHKRLSRALAGIEARLADATRKRSAAEARLADLARATGDELGRLLAERPLPAPKRARRKTGATPRPPYREFRSASGIPLLVGRGADRNDELTFKVARGSDLWLHTRDVPGAHVIVPLSPGHAVDEQTLFDAATLAAYHSNARGEPQVDVSYTLRKHVRKPPRARPGTVLLSGAKTLRVRIEAARLERLLASLRVES